MFSHSHKRRTSGRPEVAVEAMEERRVLSAVSVAAAAVSADMPSSNGALLPAVQKLNESTSDSSQKESVVAEPNRDSWIIIDSMYSQFGNGHTFGDLVGAYSDGLNTDQSGEAVAEPDWDSWIIIDTLFQQTGKRTTLGDVVVV